MGCSFLVDWTDKASHGGIQRKLIVKVASLNMLLQKALNDDALLLNRARYEQ